MTRFMTRRSSKLVIETSLKLQKNHSVVDMNIIPEGSNPASSTNSRSGLDQSRPLHPIKFAASGDTVQNQPQVYNGLNRAVKCRESVLECRETVTSPEQITYGLGTRECHKFRAELFSTMPSIAYEAAHKYVRISKQASYVQANLFLSKLSKELQIADLNLSKDIRELKLFSKQKANQCLRNTAHLTTEQAFDYCVSKLEKYGFTKPIGFQIKGEGKPYVPKPSDKEWSKISLEWMAWGYGVSVTPMQTLMFYNAVANNGVMVKPRFVKELRRQDKTEKVFETTVVSSKIASQETINKIRKVMENVVVKGTADNIYSSNFSMAGKTGTAKKWIPTHKNSKGERILGHYSNKHYVASFAGFFPADEPKYSCIVVVSDPDKKKGYYGATVAAPIFKEIAQKIYTTTPIDNQSVNDKVEFAAINKHYKKYNKALNKGYTKMPNVKGMNGMDAVSMLENIGLKVQFSGVGKVKTQSIKKGERLVKGATIILKLS